MESKTQLNSKHNTSWFDRWESSRPLKKRIIIRLTIFPTQFLKRGLFVIIWTQELGKISAYFFYNPILRIRFEQVLYLCIDSEHYEMKYEFKNNNNKTAI